MGPLLWKVFLSKGAGILIHSYNTIPGGKKNQKNLSLLLNPLERFNPLLKKASLCFSQTIYMQHAQISPLVNF